MQRVKKGYGAVKKMILVLLLALVLYIVFISDINLEDVYLFNLKPIIVQSNTMEPYIKEGSLVVVKKAQIKDLKNLDVIAYNKEDRIILHRAFLDDGVLKTKADTEKRFDFYTVDDDELIGYVVLRVNLPVFKFLDKIETDNGVSVDDVEI